MTKKRKKVGKRTARKATNSEVRRRAAEVLEMLQDGKSHAQILRYTAENWGIAGRTAETYIQRASETLTKLLEGRARYMLADCIAKLDAIHDGAMGGDFRYTASGESYLVVDRQVARQCVMDKAKLLGLSVDRLRIEDERDEELDDLPTEELKAKLG